MPKFVWKKARENHDWADRYMSVFTFSPVTDSHGRQYTAYFSPIIENIWYGELEKTEDTEDTVWYKLEDLILG